MGSLFKQQYTRALPSKHETKERKRKATRKELLADPTETTIVETVARWRDRNGKMVEGVVMGNRVRMTVATWSAKYRDSDGVLRIVATGCKEKDNARDVLAELERLKERIRIGVVSKSEVSVADSAKSAIGEHIESYLESLQHQPGKGKRERVSASHVVNVRRSLYRIVNDCEFKTLKDITSDQVARWVTTQLEDKELDWSARTINSHIEALKAFCTWCVVASPQRSQTNPVARFPMLGDDAKRPRRALNLEEIERLTIVARLRPIAEYGRRVVKKEDKTKPASGKSRATWTREALTFENIQEAFAQGKQSLAKSPKKISELERLGEERELLYRVLVTTGLRQGEIQSITLGQCHLGESPAWLELHFQDDKAGRGAKIPLREDVADALRGYVERRIQNQGEGDATLNAPLFCVPDKLVRILDRDLAAANIAKKDERGRTVDDHAMRHTFATMLTTAGISPRVAQEAMRHSTVELTMRTYTDPKLLDIAGAIEALPTIRSNKTDAAKSELDEANSYRPLTPPLTPDSVQGGLFESISDTFGGWTTEESGHEKTPVFLGNTGVFDSRGERIRTSDPLVPNQMR